MDKPCCGNCRYWEMHSAALQDRHYREDGRFRGACLRRAPAPVSSMSLVGRLDDFRTWHDETTWPSTISDQWCGEHAPREGSDDESEERDGIGS